MSALDKECIVDTEEVLYKIGVTSQNKNKRIKQLATGTAKKLEIIKEFQSKYPFKVESTLHFYFKNKKINREWFKLDPIDISCFLSLCEKYEQSFKVLDENNNPFFNI